MQARTAPPPDSGPSIADLAALWADTVREVRAAATDDGTLDNEQAAAEAVA